MNQLVKINQPHLRISHQSEVLLLRKAVADLQAEMKEMKQQMNHVNTSTQPRKITLSSNGQHHFIALDDIIYCEADGNYTKVFIRQENGTLTSASLSHRTSADFGYRSVDALSQRIILISKTLKSMTDLISSTDFIRCHQSYLINKKYVAGYESSDGLQLKLSNRKSIPVSRRNKKLVLDAI